MKHTKIVAMISDKRCEPEFIEALYQAGMGVARRLALSYGVRAILIEPKKNKFKLVRSSLKKLENAGKLKKEDMVVYVGGSFGIGGGSTFMEISTVDRLTYKEKE